MGGGKKGKPKPAKELALTKEKEKKKEEKKDTKIYTGILIDQKTLEDIKRDIMKMKFITPYQLHSKYNIKYSVAKDIIEMFESQKLLKAIKTGRRLGIYLPAS